MKKTLILIWVFAIGLMLNDVMAQVGRNRSWASVGMLYDWQFDKGGIGDFKKASNIGFRLSVGSELNHMWGYRLHISLPGILPGDGYDRRGIGGADFLFFLNNTVAGDRTWGNVYFLVGLDVAYGVENTDIVSFGFDAGCGYSHWFDKYNGVFGEMDISFFNAVNGPSCTLSFGYQRKF